MLEISLVGGIAFGGLAAALLLLAWLRRIRSRVAVQRSAPREGASAEAGAGGSVGTGSGAGLGAGLGADPVGRRLELRLEALEARLAEQEAQGSPEERLRDMAGSLVGLIRDKNATLETALAGLDQMRARLRTLERIGDVAEARALFEQIEARLDTLGTAQAAQETRVEERFAALRARAEEDAAPRAALAQQFARLYDQKDAGIAAVLARLAPLEARLAGLEEKEGARETREEMRGDSSVEAELAARIEARIEARVEARVDDRIGTLETTWAATREAGEIARAEMYAEMRDETRAAREAEKRAETDTILATIAPVRDLAERLAGLHETKEALAESLLARLGTLEARVAAQDPRGALDLFAARLDAVRAAREDAEAGLRDRIGALERPEENPFSEISERLTRLYAQKDTTVETVFARLAPLETRLAEIEAGLVELRIGLVSQDARGALDGLSKRLGLIEVRIETRIDAVAEESAALIASGIATESALRAAEVRDAREMARAAAEDVADLLVDQLGGVETRIDTRIDAVGRESVALIASGLATEGAIRAAEVREAVDALADQMTGRLGAVESRVSESVETAARLTTEVAARLGTEIATEIAAERASRVIEIDTERASRATEMETERASRVTEIATGIAIERALRMTEAEEARHAAREAVQREVQAALDVFTDRLEAARAAQAEVVAEFGARIGALEHPAEDPVAALEATFSDRLAALAEQKEATVETVVSLLEPLEIRLAGIESDLAARALLHALDHVAERFGERLEAAEIRVEARIEESARESAALIATGIAAEQATREAAAQAHVEAQAGLRDRIGALEQPAENPFLARLAPLETRLGDIETGLAEIGAGLAGVKTGLAEMGTEMEAPRGTLERLAERIEAVRIEVARIEADEARRAAADLPSRSAEEEAEARAEAHAAAAALIAQQTALFANRLALLEASLPGPILPGPSLLGPSLLGPSLARAPAPVTFAAESGTDLGADLPADLALWIAGSDEVEEAEDPTAPDWSGVGVSEDVSEAGTPCVSLLETGSTGIGTETETETGAEITGSMPSETPEGAAGPDAAWDADLAAIRNMPRIVSLRRN